MEWISVEDRLPKKSTPERSEMVLIWSPDFHRFNSGCPYVTGYLDFDENEWLSTEGRNWLYHVSHWMPLPEPPEPDIFDKTYEPV